jgi:hypothetical protein
VGGSVGVVRRHYHSSDGLCRCVVGGRPAHAASAACLLACLLACFSVGSIVSLEAVFDSICTRDAKIQAQL